MNQQTEHVSDEPGESGLSPPLQNTTYHNLDNDSSHFYNNLNSDLSQQLNDAIKQFDSQRMIFDQGNAVMGLKMFEYEKAIAERENTIRSLLADMNNSKNNNDVLISQYKNIMNKTKFVIDNCINLNTSFKKICEHFNTLRDTVDDAKTRKKEVMDLVSQTTKTYQEQILNISDTIEDRFKQMNTEKIRVKEELETLKNKYSLDLIACKTNIEEFTNEINNLKSELIKLNEEKIMDITQQLELQKENENKNQSDEVLRLKQEIEICNNTIQNLQDEGKANTILIPELQNKIDGLNANLNDTYKKLENSSNDFLIEKNTLEKEKCALEHQGQERFKQIEKLTMNYMKYKSKAKQLYVEAMSLRSLCSHLGQKKNQLPQTETVEVVSDGEENIADVNDDVSIFEFNHQNEMDVSSYSTSSKINQKSIYSSVKRNSSFVMPVDESIIKKPRTADNLATSQRNIDHIQNTKENIEPNKSNLKFTPLKKKIDVNNEISNIVGNLNTTSNLHSKETFRIPADLQSSQKKKKPAKIQDVKTKPNSPVTLTVLSSKQNVQPKDSNTK